MRRSGSPRDRSDGNGSGSGPVSSGGSSCCRRTTLLGDASLGHLTCSRLHSRIAAAGSEAGCGRQAVISPGSCLSQLPTRVVLRALLAGRSASERASTNKSCTIGVRIRPRDADHLRIYGPPRTYHHPPWWMRISVGGG